MLSQSLDLDGMDDFGAGQPTRTDGPHTHTYTRTNIHTDRQTHTQAYATLGLAAEQGDFVDVSRV